jgi:glycosyltransferase involved in cell wall biosynthesis
LERVLDWMVAQDRGDGALICPKHRVEHTGKSAGAIVLACELARHGARNTDGLLALALTQGRRLVSRLQREGESTCFTFRPGRHDPFNCSNNVIDGGACSDALAQLVTTFGERLTASERESFQHACVLHAQTYLRYAVTDKPIPAQRAWAMTGVAGAARLSGYEVLHLAVVEGAKGLARDQHADGSYPYHPRGAGAPHPGSSDVSSYYQGRVSAFLVHSLERVGIDPLQTPHAEALCNGLDFLAALYGPDGYKCSLLEAKPWYWEGHGEVVSHPFDVFALARGWRLFGKAAYGRAALAAYRAWASCLDRDGRPRARRGRDGREDYQCSLFWAGHACWAARALEDLEALDAAGQEGLSPAPAVQEFEQASLYRLENERVVAWVRGSRPGRNAMHGSPHGAGLIRVVSKATGSELLQRRMDGDPRGAAIEGEWCARAGIWNAARGMRAGAADLRFSLWLARVAWRSAGLRAALGEPVRRLRDGVLAFASRRVRSDMDLLPTCSSLPRGVQIESHLARPDGQVLSGSRLIRRFELDAAGLLVDDHLIERGAARSVRYRVPAAARDVQRDPGRVRYSLAGPVPSSSSEQPLPRVPLALVANARMPSQRAQSLQVAQVAAAFQSLGVPTTLYYARRRNTPVLESSQLLALYGVHGSAPDTQALPCVDWIDRLPLALQFVPARLQEWTLARSALKVLGLLDGNTRILTREIEVAHGLRGRPRVFLELHRVPGGRLRRRWLRAAAAQVAGIVAISEGVQEDLIDLGISPHGICVAHDGVDLRRFADGPTRSEARIALELTEREHLVVYTGGLLEWKGVDEILVAARLLPDVQFVIAGGMDADVACLRSLATDLPNLRLDGFQPAERVPLYLAAGDLGLVPNRSTPAISARYTSPLKVFEAMAAGLPLVCSDLPSLRALLSSDEAEFVTPDDGRALAAGIEGLLADGDRRSRLAAAMAARAAQHTWQSRARRLLRWMDEREAQGTAAGSPGS